MKIWKILMLVVLVTTACTHEEIEQDQPLPLAKSENPDPESATVYTIGDPDDITTTTTGGTVLMGGSDANSVAEERAFEWMVSNSGGGDFVVIRSSGSDGYNNFIYNTIGGVNSVESIIITSRDEANDPAVETIIRNAEALFIAGGNQKTYNDYWKGTKVESAVNYLRNTKNVPVGGSSAGCAILGGYYYYAENGSVTSNDALRNPYTSRMDGISDDFLDMPYLSTTITDTHYANRDREGRHVAFMARIVKDFGESYTQIRGIGVDERTAVLIDEDGIAEVFGTGKAYFIQGNNGVPEKCQSGQKLDWYRSRRALKTYQITGNSSGGRYFDLDNWNSGSGGTWKYWYVDRGRFRTRNF